MSLIPCLSIVLFFLLPIPSQSQDSTAPEVPHYLQSEEHSDTDPSESSLLLQTDWSQVEAEPCTQAHREILLKKRGLVAYNNFYDRHICEGPLATTPQMEASREQVSAMLVQMQRTVMQDAKRVVRRFPILKTVGVALYVCGPSFSEVVKDAIRYIRNGNEATLREKYFEFREVYCRMNLRF